eukprot:scaffold4849_cov153-Amphora_coffeaeformis.AAC.2
MARLTTESRIRRSPGHNTFPEAPPSRVLIDSTVGKHGRSPGHNTFPEAPPSRVLIDSTVGKHPSVESDEETSDPTLDCHGVTWVRDKDSVQINFKSTVTGRSLIANGESKTLWGIIIPQIDCNGPVPYRQWRVKDVMGNHYSSQSDLQKYRRGLITSS